MNIIDGISLLLFYHTQRFIRGRPRLLIKILTLVKCLQTFAGIKCCYYCGQIYRVLHACGRRGPRGLTFTWWGCCGVRQRHKPTELAHSFFFGSCVCFCLYGPFNCVSFHTFSGQLSAFSLCSSGLNSALYIYQSLPQP